MILTEPSHPHTPSRSPEHIAVLQREFGDEKTQAIIETDVQKKFALDRMGGIALRPVDKKDKA